MVWGGRREEGSGWGTHVYLWRIHFDIWQNQYNIVKLNKIKLKKKPKKKKERGSVRFGGDLGSGSASAVLVQGLAPVALGQDSTMNTFWLLLFYFTVVDSNIASP